MCVSGTDRTNVCWVKEGCSSLQPKACSSLPLEVVDYVDEFDAKKLNLYLKVARYTFSGPIPPKFEHKLRRRKQSFGKIDTTVVLDKDENLV